MEEVEEGLRYHHQAFEMRKLCLPEYHQDLAASYEHIGLIHHRFGQFNEAFDSLGKSLQIKQKSLPNDHPHIGFTHNNFGSVHYLAGSYDKALSCFEQALKIYRKRFKEDHPEILNVKKNIEHAREALQKKDNQ